MTNAKAWFNNSLRPRKPEGSLARTAQDVHLTLTQLLNYERKNIQTETITSKEQKKAQVCVVHFQGLAGELIFFLNIRFMRFCNNKTMLGWVKTRILTFLDLGGRGVKSSTVTTRHV